MDYEGEQAMELEALEAILMDDLIEYEGNLPDHWVATGNTYKVVIDPSEEEGAEETEYPVKMELLFAHTPKYPEEAPSIKLRSVMGLSDADLAEATAVLNEQVEANLGMAMIYTLIGAAKEWLSSRAGSGPGVDPEVAARKALEEEERKRLELRAHGTPVTIENFAVWKAKFDAELAAKKAAAALDVTKDDEKTRRLSGKQFFLRQAQAGGDLGDVIDEDEEDVDYEAEAAAAAAEGGDEEEDEDWEPEEDDLDYEDDDDEGMLDEL